MCLKRITSSCGVENERQLDTACRDDRRWPRSSRRATARAAPCLSDSPRLLRTSRRAQVWGILFEYSCIHSPCTFLENRDSLRLSTNSVRGAAWRGAARAACARSWAWSGPARSRRSRSRRSRARPRTSPRRPTWRNPSSSAPAPRQRSKFSTSLSCLVSRDARSLRRRNERASNPPAVSPRRNDASRSRRLRQGARLGARAPPSDPAAVQAAPGARYSSHSSHSKPSLVGVVVLNRSHSTQARYVGAEEASQRDEVETAVCGALANLRDPRANSVENSVCV